jgi:hypothetical protein
MSIREAIMLNVKGQFIRLPPVGYANDRQAEANLDENSKKQSSSKSILKQMRPKTSDRID